MGINIFVNNIIELFLEFLFEKGISDDLIPVERWHAIKDKATTLAGRFNADYNIEVAELIIDNFEEALVDAGINIENDEKDTEDAALIFGDDYYYLEEAIVGYSKQLLA